MGPEAHFWLAGYKSAVDHRVNNMDWRPCKYAKSILMEFYQLHGGTPVFELDSRDRGPLFSCKLTIPAVRTSKGGFSERSFAASGRSKKGAEHSAAELALRFIASCGLFSPPLSATATNTLPSQHFSLKSLKDEVEFPSTLS